MYVDRYTADSERIAPSLTWGISSWFPLANHFDLPGSESEFGISKDPPMCVYTSLRDMDSSKQASGQLT